MGCFLTEGTELRHRQIQQGPVTIECEYDEAYSAPEVVSLAVEACAGGEIDGIFVNCFGDPGVRALREKEERAEILQRLSDGEIDVDTAIEALHQLKGEK